MLKSLMAAVRRLFDPGERRARLVRSEDPRYELFYDKKGRLLLEFQTGPDTLPVQVELNTAQHDRWVKEGAAFIHALYREIIQAHDADAELHFDPAVVSQLVRTFPAAIVQRAGRHIAQYGADRPATIRVQLALLRLAGGDVHELKRLLELAREDHREVLQLADDVDEAVPLAPGRSGINPATGSIHADEITISAETEAVELQQDELLEGAPEVIPEPMSFTLLRPLTIAGTSFNVVLEFNHDGLAAASLTPVENVDPADWLRTNNAGSTSQVFAWGKLDLEPEGATPTTIVLRYRY